MFGIDDAIGLGIGAIGLGMQVFGGMGAANASKEIAKASADKAMHEGNINDLKTTQMELEGRRSLLQTYRNAQRATAMGINSSVNQGAQFGTGMLGGMWDTQNQGTFNAIGINSGLAIGRDIGQENKAISKDNEQIASLQGKAAESQGWSSLGGALMKSSGLVGSLAGNFGGLFKGSSNPYYGPLDYNG